MAVHTPPARLSPLVLWAMGSQAMLVVLSPTISSVAHDLGSSITAVGQARSVTAVVAIAASLALMRGTRVLDISSLAALGAGLAVVASAAIAAAPTLAIFLAAHALAGVAFACLLSAAFSGVAAIEAGTRAGALGWVAGGNSLAWVVVAPVVGLVTDLVSWRAAQLVPATVALAGLVAARSRRGAWGRTATAGVGRVLHDRPARRWVTGESVAFGAWAAVLTFIGAFFVRQFNADEATTGLILAVGALAHLWASTRAGRFAARWSRRLLVTTSTTLMAVLVTVLLALAGSLALAAVCFWVIGLAAGVRTPASAGIGMEQLRGYPAAMMTARTAATQTGYLVGASVGGAVIAGPGYPTLGVVLAAGLLLSAALLARVPEPDRLGVGSGAGDQRGRRGSSRPTGQAQLDVGIGQVPLDGPLAENEPLADGRVGQPRGDEPQHLGFPAGQVLDERVLRPALGRG